MSRDNHNQVTKKTTSSKKTNEKLKKVNESSDNSDSEYTSEMSTCDDDDDYDSSEEEDEEDKIDIQEYRKLLYELFPSKHLKKKIDSGDNVKKIIKELEDQDESDEYSSEEENNKKMKLRKNKKSKLKSDKKNEKKKDIKNDKKKDVKNDKKNEKKSKKYSDEEEDDEKSSDEDSEEDTSRNKKDDKQKLNIIFTIDNGENEYDDYDEEEWEDMNDDETEDENESVSTVSSSEDENEDDDSDEEDNNKKENNENKTKKDKLIVKGAKVLEKETDKNDIKKKTKNSHTSEEVIEKIKNVIETPESDEQILSKLKTIYEENKCNKTIKQCIDICESNIKKNKGKMEKKIKKQSDKNLRIFRRIAKDKNAMNDSSFFEKMKVEEQKKIIGELREINKISRIEKPYKLTLLDADIPVIFKSAAITKINSLKYMEPGSGEYYKIKTWVDSFMRIPFGKYKTLPIHISDGVDKCHEFMETAKEKLDNAVYGLNEAKLQIMQMLGQLITNPSAIGSSIAIQGPMGTGKTSLIKDGISKILDRPFAFIALGGATDSSFLEGHSYTYEGSLWGKIVQILIDSRCMNPVIYFDELDKVSDTPKGEEIIGILTHLTDTSQNNQFHDKYFAEIDFDLSKCLFIFSYNDENKINPILKDRMYKIHTKGYDRKQKTVISNNYLLPRIREQVKFNTEDIIIPDESIHYIIEHHCNKEEGVRNLKRCYEIIYTKLNLYRLMKPGSNLFEQDMSIKVEFPFTVTKDILDKLIKSNKDENATYKSFYL